MCIKSNPSDVNQFIRWLFSLSYVLLSLIRLPRRSINQKAARSWLEGTQAGSRQAAFHGQGCLEHSPRHQKEHERFAKWKGKKKKSEALRWLPLKSTALFQVIEASYRHIKIIMIRLVECLQSKLGTKVVISPPCWHRKSLLLTDPASVST